MDSKTTITIIGSGNWVMDNSGAMPAFLLQHGESNILLDCGAGTGNQLLRANIDPQIVDAIVLTHFHDDHFGDVPTFVSMRWARSRIEKGRLEPLAILGPTTLSERLQKSSDAIGTTVLSEHPIGIREINTSGNQTSEISVGPFQFQGFTVNHVPNMICYSWRVTTPDGKVIVFSGDANANQDETGFRAALEGADVAIIEAGAMKPNNPTHLTVEEAAEFAREAGIERLFFNHLDNELRKRAEIFVKKHDKDPQTFEEVSPLTDGFVIKT